MTNSKVVWIGLVEVVPTRGDSLLGAARGGYVNALVPASDKEDYRKRVVEAAAALGFHVAEVESPEPFLVRQAHYEIDPDLRALYSKALEVDAVFFGTFHSFPLDDVDD